MRRQANYTQGTLTVTRLDFSSEFDKNLLNSAKNVTSNSKGNFIKEKDGFTIKDDNLIKAFYNDCDSTFNRVDLADISQREKFLKQINGSIPEEAFLMDLRKTIAPLFYMEDKAELIEKLKQQKVDLDFNFIRSTIKQHENLKKDAEITFPLTNRLNTALNTFVDYNVRSFLIYNQFDDIVFLRELIQLLIDLNISYAGKNVIFNLCKSLKDALEGEYRSVEDGFSNRLSLLLELMNDLVKLGVNPNDTPKDNVHPLVLVFQINTKNLKSGLDVIKDHLIGMPNMDISCKTPNGKTILHLAIQQQDELSVIRLLNNGIDIKIKDNTQEDALRLAYRLGAGSGIYKILKKYSLKTFMYESRSKQSEQLQSFGVNFSAAASNDQSKKRKVDAIDETIPRNQEASSSEEPDRKRAKMR